MPNIREKNSVKRNKKINLLIALPLILIALILPLLANIFFRSSNRTAKTALKATPACTDYFHNETYGDANEVNVVLIGGIHGASEQQTVDCLKSLVAKGDHLLIEAPKNGEKVPCDFLHSTYAQFNGILECYAFDVSVDNNRLTYNDLAEQARFLSGEFTAFFKNAISKKDLTQKLNEYAKFLTNIDTDSLYTKAKALAKKRGVNDGALNMDANPQFVQNRLKFLTNFTKKISKLPFEKIYEFAVQENHRLVQEAEHYEKLSRKGPTNEALVTELQKHQQLIGSEHRLFATSGAAHVDISENDHLKKLTKKAKREKSMTILQSNVYLRSNYRETNAFP